jgi:HD-like signal output (HDOD) protein
VYTAGLIHAIGELVMHVGMPEAMASVNDNVPMFDLRRAAAEKAYFGYSYAEVGAGLARAWRFPKRMVVGMENQLEPFEHSNIEPISAVVHLASWRARVAFSDIALAHRIASYPDAVGVALGVDPDTLMADDIPVLEGLGESLSH